MYYGTRIIMIVKIKNDQKKSINEYASPLAIDQIIDYIKKKIKT